MTQFDLPQKKEDKKESKKVIAQIGEYSADELKAIAKDPKKSKNIHGAVLEKDKKEHIKVTALNTPMDEIIKKAIKEKLKSLLYIQKKDK